ncbi:MAG: HAMP domain-containing sensor histidine kinase [Microthrixaceae bacterium]
MKLPLRLRLALAVATTAALTMLALYGASGWLLERRFRAVATETAGMEAEEMLDFADDQALDDADAVEVGQLWQELLGASGELQRIASESGGGEGAVPLLVSRDVAVAIPVDPARPVRAVDPTEVDGPLVVESLLEGTALTSLSPERLDAVFSDGAIFDPAVVDTGTQVEVVDGLPLPPETVEEIGLAQFDGPVPDFELATTEVDGFDTLVWIDRADSDAAAEEIRRWLLVAAPVVAFAAGLTASYVSRWALGPVDRMTRQVADIDAQSLDERVPAPRSADEIGRLAATLNGLLDRLHTSVDTQRQFVADASHELRSPVAVLQHSATLATQGALEPDELSDVVATESERLDRLVDDLLVLARHDAAPPAAAAPELDLDDLVLDEAARARAVPVGIDDVSPAKVRGSAETLRRLVGHLLDNAARHADSQVSIGLSRSCGDVVLVVDDDGPGVPPGDRERVFERFVRLDEARSRDHGGAGLGLAVVAASVGKLGGSVDVAESPTGGARFTVRLPDANSTRQ